MRCISILTFILILFQADVFAQLSSSSCSLLRTADSLSGIVPEIAQLAMRFYRASSFSIEHHRQKRFLFNSNQRKNTSSSRNDLKSTLIEQMISNSVQDINFTSIAIVLLNNNETANKIRQNIDNEAIIRVILQEIDYEKLGRGLKSAAEKDFDLEQFVVNIINITHMDIIHEELMTNGTLPEWLLKKIHPDLTNHEIHRTFSALKNITNQFVRAFSKSGRFDNFLYNMITQQALAPLSYIIQGVQESKPKTFNQLIEIIIDNFNKVAKVRKI